MQLLGWHLPGQAKSAAAMYNTARWLAGGVADVLPKLLVFKVV